MIETVELRADLADLHRLDLLDHGEGAKHDSRFLYQSVELASSPVRYNLLGHHLLTSGVSMTSPSTLGAPLQSFQLLSLHSAAAPVAVIAIASPAAADKNCPDFIVLPPKG